MEHPFRGRSIQVVGDLSPDEQVYLYEKTRELKAALGRGERAKSFRIQNPDIGFYLMFFEDSTRTKESFRNAAIFHGLKVNDFDARHSSVQKKESITDTVKMLVGYSASSVFVVRSRQEGVCRWLEQHIGRYAAKAGIPRPSFINAGDGRHEHPTQEFLDEFSFLEQLNWDRSHIHIALVGDLFHGRTVHSKTEGLRIFDQVDVDLIAPPELGMPKHYVQQMKQNGFKLRVFPSIESYLEQKTVAPIWYFTRLQLERMGDRILEKAEVLRNSVTFKREFLPKIAEGTRFYHPLPQNSENPTLPSFLDDTPLNGWDEQSRNGYFTRIVAIGLLAGALGDDFKGKSVIERRFDEAFIEEAPLRTKVKPEYKVGIRPVDNGIVIDHIGTGSSIREIWDHIYKIRMILDLHMVSSDGVYPSANDKKVYKGILSIPDLERLDDKKLKMLAAIAPNCTLNIVRDSRVVKKYRLRMPPRVYKLDGLRCRNEDCISHPKNFEPVIPEFRRLREGTFVCLYCNTPHEYKEIWQSATEPAAPRPQ